MSNLPERVSERISLLLVDDDPEFLEILHRRFTRRGLATTACRDTATALSSAREQRFDVAMIDRTLRTGDGIQLLKQLKLADSQLRVIILSGHAESAMVVAALEAGACEYLLKPCGFAEMEAAVARALAPATCTS
jgi:ActR/RegA family two-component response regulator